MEKWEDGNGNNLTFERGSQPGEEDWGELKVIRSNNGNNIHFNYDLYGHITDAFANDGRHLKYEYDTYGDLTQVTLPDNSVIKYNYEHKEIPPEAKNSQETGDKQVEPTSYSTHLIIKEEKPEGRLMENVYDAERRVTIQLTRTGKGSEVKANATFHYDLTKNEDKTYSGITTVKDVLGKSFSYKIEGNQIVEETNQNGESIKTSWQTGPYSRQKVSRTDLRGLKTDYQYDEHGNLTSIIETGNLTGKNSNETATTKLTYTKTNLLESITDAERKTTTYHYEDSAHPYMATSISQPGSTITKKYGDSGNDEASACGLLIQENNNGAVTNYEYDAHGFLKEKKEHTGTHDSDVITEYQSDHRGEIVETTLFDKSKIKNEYDAMGNPTGKETYDSSGNLIDWEYVYYNGNGEPTWHQGAQFNPVNYGYKSYDPMGRVSEESTWRSQASQDGKGIADAGVATTFHIYDDYGNELERVDHNHNMTTMKYDAIGNIVQVNHNQGDNASSPILSSEYFAYRPGGDVIKHVTPLGATERMSYNSRGQLIEKIKANGTKIAYNYDLLGRTVEESLANGVRWSIVYNDKEHIVTKSYFNASGKQLGQEIKQYDGRGNLIAYTDLANNTFTKTYDGLNRVKSEKSPHDSNSSEKETFYIYNNLLNSQDVINGKGERTLIFLDALQRPIWRGSYNQGGKLALEESDWYGPDHHSHIHYQGNGQEAIETTTYLDEASRPVITKVADGATQITSFDAMGNKTSFTDEGGLVTTWTYDALNHLTSETRPGGITVSYNYNAAGELLSRSMPGGITEKNSYNQASQKIEDELVGSDGSITRHHNYNYGNNGLVSSITDPRGFTTSIIYDDWNRPINKSSSGSTVPEQNQNTTYAYDPRGLLTSVTQSYGDSSTGPESKVTREYNACGQLVNETTSLNGTNIASWQQEWDGAGRRVGLNWKLEKQGPEYQFA
ncbi:MAG: hypothetical protein ACH346_01840, partial [Chthoniobacterales bacterium]